MGPIDWKIGQWCNFRRGGGGGGGGVGIGLNNISFRTRKEIYSNTFIFWVLFTTTKHWRYKCRPTTVPVKYIVNTSIFAIEIIFTEHISLFCTIHTYQSHCRLYAYTCYYLDVLNNLVWCSKILIALIFESSVYCHCFKIVVSVFSINTQFQCDFAIGKGIPWYHCLHWFPRQGTYNCKQ